MQRYAVVFYDPNEPAGVSTFWCTETNEESARIRGNLWYWGTESQTDLSVEVVVSILN